MDFCLRVFKQKGADCKTRYHKKISENFSECKMKCRLLRADVFRVDEENVVDSRNKRGYYITIKAREP